MSCKTSQYTYAKNQKLLRKGKQGDLLTLLGTPVLNDFDVYLLSELELFSDQI